MFADSAGHDHAIASDRVHRGGEGGGPPPVAGRRRSLPAPHDVQEQDEVHVGADRDRRVAAGQAAGGDDDVVDGADPEAAVLGRDRCVEVPGALERVDGGVRERRLAVVERGAAREVLGERLGDPHQACAGGGLGGEFEHVGHPVSGGGRDGPGRRPGAQSVATSTATGTPLVTMS